MEKLKKYFLFVCENSVFWAIVVSFVLFIVYLICVVVVTTVFKLGAQVPNLVRIGTAIAICFACILSGVNSLVSLFAITTFFPDKKSILLIYREENKPEIYKKPIWGKYPYKIIELPDKWIMPLSDRTKSVILFISLLVNNRKLLLPFRLSFYFYGELRANDLHILIMAQKKETREKSTINLEDCIKYIFEKYNLTKEKEEEIKNIVTDWTNEQESLAKLTMGFKDKVCFPSEIFPRAAIEAKLLTLCIKFKEINNLKEEKSNA
jgi:hypothetical protein